MEQKEKAFDITEPMNDMDGGVFMQRVSRAARDVARAVVDQDDSRPKKGQITITMDLAKIGSSRQVEIAHDVKYVMPTPGGKKAENHTTKTPMHVNSRGHFSIFPENQGDLWPKKQTADSE